MIGFDAAAPTSSQSNERSAFAAQEECMEYRQLDNLAAAEVRLSAEQIARLDAASAVRPAYPYWHQRRTFLKRNPPPV
jgi:hypothetical protein